MSARLLSNLLALLACAVIAGCGGGGGSTTGSGASPPTGGATTGSGSSAPTGGQGKTGDPVIDRIVKQCLDEAKQIPVESERAQARKDCEESAR